MSGSGSPSDFWLYDSEENENECPLPCCGLAVRVGVRSGGCLRSAHDRVCIQLESDDTISC
jgi:hypothetical protein